MNTSGFLPLIEAFLAFALTMLALTTAVASIAGAWQRLFRWRSRGLRDTVEYLYRNTLRPRLEKHDVKHSEAEWDEKRRRFIAEMTLAPVPQIANHFDASTDWRMQTISRSENPVFTIINRSFFKGWNRWRSLRHGLDWLSDTEFRARLDDSTAGAEIAELVDSKAAEDLLLQRFKALGNAATESFARRSRVLTIIAGFMFAIGVNIDSINLFNSYLSDPELRNQIIESQEQILDRTMNAGFAETIDENHSQVETTLERLSAAVQEMEDAVAAAGDAASSSGLQRALDLAKNTESGLQQVQTELTAVKEDSRELQAAYTDIRSVAVGVSQSFPVGWNLYPNCTRYSSDARCVVLITNGRLDPGTGSDVENVEVTAVKSGGKASSGSASGGAVYDADPATYWRWIFGVLLTGIMVGLGTPFWVQAVNGALAAKNWIQKGDGDESAPAEAKSPANDAGAMSTTKTTTNSNGALRPVILDLDKAMQVAREATTKTEKQ